MITKEQFVQERIANHESKCQTCHGTGTVDYKITGEGPSVKIACGRCADFKSRLDLFCRGFFNPKYVLPRYWDAVHLSKLQPSPVARRALDRQAGLIKEIQGNTNQGYALFGPSEIGKTTVTVGLYAKVLYDELMSADIKPSYRVPVRRLTSKVMLDQQQAWMLRGKPEEDAVPEPDVTREGIIRCFENGSKYRLFLEEIDKVKETEARRANLFEVLDTLHGCMGQFVMTSNLTPDKFTQDFGADLYHRISSSAEVINLW